MSKQSSICPLCANIKTTFHRKIERDNYYFNTSRCLGCGFEYTDPAPDPQTLLNYYGADYYEATADYSYKDERKTKKFEDYVFRARLKNIRRWKNSGNFLDIGCSFGGLLDMAKSFGYKTYGNEISEYSSKVAEEKGHQVRNGSFLNERFKTDYDSNFFDAITMIEVIEHLPAPAATWSELYRILKPGGVLVVQTADMTARQAKRAGDTYHYYLPGHIAYYNAELMFTIRDKFDFRKLKVYRPVDFGLLPKLLKSRGNFQNIWQYKNWLRTSFYHLTGKLAWGNKAYQSSMVCYFQK